ncbi:uncharacterized protein LOC109791098 [Cajanus cajan]|uniref:uncharacterized protein LOC109791098 n=1 Tax=Cajanus cajan TaxID=3821 RepID=UPI00098DA0AE|nr:uncharacterized protein LOC109791098 [Cajanus cajan]
MRANKNVVMLKSVGSLEVNTQMQQSTDFQTGKFSSQTCITYLLGKTRVTLNVTLEDANVVHINLSEDSGKGSSANLYLVVTRNDRYGIICNYMNTKFMGSYDSCKENYCAPPLQDREVIRCLCRESGPGGCFTVVKKKDENDVTERVKAATYNFIVGEETMHVKIRIRKEGREGLKVEVEGPVKLTTEYMIHVVSRMEEKMESDQKGVSLVRNSKSQRPHDVNMEHAVDDRVLTQWGIDGRVKSR